MSPIMVISFPTFVFDFEIVFPGLTGFGVGFCVGVGFLDVLAWGTGLFNDFGILEV